jgi:hypothetical protein
MAKAMLDEISPLFTKFVNDNFPKGLTVEPDEKVIITTTGGDIWRIVDEIRTNIKRFEVEAAVKAVKEVQSQLLGKIDKLFELAAKEKI